MSVSLMNLWKKWAARSVSRSRKSARGMTLVEIMVVVVIISLVAGVVGVAVLQRLGDAQKKVAFTQIRQISDALDLYKLSFRNYPSTAEGLNALVAPKNGEKPFLPSVPKDPWGNDYVYVYPGTHNPGSFDLMSYGSDGVQGGGDDVGNWDQTAAQ
ncbi:MAG TPA: type II secretion system major pseudopilin GspG [Myxococcota bacterium]|nr:type II secretion system major pseudopilin GspG [Myxococcota bacterium]